MLDHWLYCTTCDRWFYEAQAVSSCPVCSAPGLAADDPGAPQPPAALV